MNDRSARHDWATTEQQLQTLADTYVSGGAPSCLLRVEVSSRSLVWSGASGTISRDDETPAEPDDAFRTASVTKPFTAAVVLQLVAEGAFGLDDSMAPLVPDELVDLVDRLHVLDGCSYGAEITVRQLLSHNSGLFDHGTSAGLLAALIADPQHTWTPRELLEGCIEWGTPRFPPGTPGAYAYSDAGYVLLGTIIERADGRPLHESFRARILHPLGLDDTYLEGHEPHRGPRLTHVYAGPHDAMQIHGSADWGAGGLVSTTADLARFVTALIDGDLVAEPLLSEMLRYDSPDIDHMDPPAEGGTLVGYGLGVDARRSRGRLLRGHIGDWGVLMHLEPQTGIVVTGTVNCSEGVAREVLDATLSLLADL